MSLTVSLTIDGDLGNIRNKDLAEHVCRLVNEAVQKAADDTPGSSVTLGDPWEMKQETSGRPLDGSRPYGTASTVTKAQMSSYVHLPEPPVDPGPADPPAS